MSGILAVPSKTAKLIARELSISLWKPGKQMPSHTDLLIRWGTACSQHPAYKKILNSPQAIKLTTNKDLCRKALQEAKIPVPYEGEDQFPCIGRTKHHSRGEGFWFCHNSEEVAKAKREGAVYFSKFYPKTNEYRVHVAGGLVILFSIKVGDKSNIIWNHSKTGFIFEHIHRGERRGDVIKLAKKAIKTVGLNFGAVDILADPDSDEDLPNAVVSEINTAPSLSPLGIKKYLNYFVRELETIDQDKDYLWDDQEEAFDDEDAEEEPEPEEDQFEEEDDDDLDDLNYFGW